MPAKAGIQGGGHGACRPGPPLSRGRREKGPPESLRLVDTTSSTSPPRFPGEACPWQGTGGRDPLLPWAPAFAGVAGFDTSDGASLPDESCEELGALAVFAVFCSENRAIGFSPPRKSWV